MGILFTHKAMQMMAAQRNQWLHAGVSAQTIDRERISKVTAKIYRELGLPEPEVFWYDSPRSALLDIKERELSIYELFTMEAEKVESNLAIDQDVNGAMAHIEDQIRVALFFLRPFRSLSLIDRQLAISARHLYVDELMCLQENLALFGYLKDRLGFKSSIIFDKTYELCQACSFWIPFLDRVLISANPLQIFFVDRAENGTDIPILHHDGGPALKYQDGFEVYALNGNWVPKDVAVLPHDQLDPHLILGEKDANVKREIARKIGNERLCQELNAEVIDQNGDYELLSLDLQDGIDRPYLKMKNPSIGIYHIEGVAPGITTVGDALAWRNGTSESPVQLT